MVVWAMKATRGSSNSNHNVDMSSKYPPGSSGIPLLGKTLPFLASHGSSKGFYDFIMRQHLRYGNCFKASLFGCTHVFVSSTQVAKDLLSCETIDFKKAYMKLLRELACRRKLLTVKYFDELIIKTMEDWERKETAVVFNDVYKIIFDVICKMLISLEEGDELDMIRKDVDLISEAMLLFPIKFPGTRFYRALKARQMMMNKLREKIAMRRKGLESHEDFLQRLLSRDIESKREEPLTDEQIMNNILILIIAGQATTASSIAWMVKYLDENQEVQETLRASQLNLTPKHSGPSLKLEDTNEMAFASKVVKESLRMSTMVSWFPRVGLKDCQIEGFRIQKGWIVNVDARSIHYDSTIYDDPMKLNPWRFQENSKPYSFLVFGTRNYIL